MSDIVLGGADSEFAIDNLVEQSYENDWAFHEPCKPFDEPSCEMSVADSSVSSAVNRKTDGRTGRTDGRTDTGELNSDDVLHEASGGNVHGNLEHEQTITNGPASVRFVSKWLIWQWAG